jgi:hypothetical protein
MLSWLQSRYKLVFPPPFSLPLERLLARANYIFTSLPNQASFFYLLQEIVRYLEWRLAQMEQLAEGKERASGGGGPLSAAFKEAAQVAAGEPPLDSFPVLPDASVSTQSSSNSGANLPRTLLALGQRGLVGIPTTAWAPPSLEDADKENITARHPPARPGADTATPATAVNPGQFTPIRSSVRSALGDITPRRHPRAVVVAEVEDDATPVLSWAVVSAAPVVVTAAGREEEQGEKPGEEGAANSFVLVEERNGDVDGLPISELEGSSTAGAPSADLKKQLFAEYSSADLKYVDSDEDDHQGGCNEGISVKAAVAALEKKKMKKDDGLDIRIRQMHTPIAEPSQQSQIQKREKQQQGQHQKKQTKNNNTRELLNNSSNAKKNNGSSAAALTPTAGPTPIYSASATPATGLRSSSRVRRSVSYALPPVNRKLRQGDPFTFGDATTIRKKNPSAAIATGGTTAAPRSRTKPRAKYASSFTKPRRKSLSIRSNSGFSEDGSPAMMTPPYVGVLPAMAEQGDFSENKNCGDGGAVEVIFS